MMPWSGPGSYLRAKIDQWGLDKIAQYGRIWRLRYDGRPAVDKTDDNPGQPAIPASKPNFTPPHMYSEAPAQLVTHLTNQNGWWSDMAQRLLVLKQDKSVAPALQQMARTSDSINGRIHALWTLEGLGALDAPLARELMKDKNPRIRVQAIRASETLYKAGDKTFADDYRAMTKDPDVNVAIQGMLSMSVFKLKDLPDVVKTTMSARKEKGIQLIGERLLAPPPPAFGGGGRGRPPLTPAEEKRLQSGSDIFNAVCFSCHGSDGLGAPLAGGTEGATMAPPLAGSPRVQAHRDYIVKVLMRGLQGPVDGKTYHEVMVPLDNTDEWVASIASFVRTSFGNNGDMVTPAEVARVRTEISSRKTPWTVDEVEATLPKPIDPEQLKFTASDGMETAMYASTLRGWTSQKPQVPGMWFQIELTAAKNVTELQFDSPGPGGGGGGRAAAAAAAAGAGGRGAAAPAPPAAGYPRSYDVQVSMDGKKWTKVASGQGTGQRTDVAFTPTQAKFVRITQTDNIQDAPAWTIRSLRVLQK
jgi:mono/diheme cytochrome c family protein